MVPHVDIALSVVASILQLQFGPLRLSLTDRIFPGGHSFSPIGRSSLQVRFDVGHLLAKHTCLRLFFRIVDDTLSLMVVIQEREEAIVLFLRHRIVFVRMTLSTLNRQTEKRLANRVHTIEHGVHAELFRVDTTFFVEHRVSQEPRCDNLVLSRSRQQVSGQLLDDKLVVRKVLVQSIDHVVPVEGNLSRLVLFETIGVCIASGVEPVAAPAFAVMRRLQQSLNLLFVGIRCRIGHERINLGNGRRQAGQIQMQSTQQRDLVRFRRCSQSRTGEFCDDEPVDLIPDSRGRFLLRHGRQDRSSKSPVRRVFSTRFNPPRQQRHLCVCERLVLSLQRWHPQTVVSTGDSLDQLTGIRLTGHDRHFPGLSRPGRSRPQIKS